ncbi:MAG: hypothetical protein AABY22_22485 [Nanoarchaeota archaeon]
MGKIYKFYCNACGTPFEPETKKGRCCSDKCRLAVNNAHLIIKAKDPNLSPEEQKQADELTVMIESSTGILKRFFTNKKDNSGTFIIKEEDVKSAAKKGMRVRKNDKNLIPGKDGKNQAKLAKKKKKEKEE